MPRSIFECRRVMQDMMKSLVYMSVAILTLSSTVRANSYGENGSWQFQTPAALATSAGVADLIEKKRSGYYGPSRTTIYNDTYIGRQTNCSVSSSSVGNSGSNGLTATSSSPSVSNGASSAAQTTGNTASNILAAADPSQVAGTGATQLASVSANAADLLGTGLASSGSTGNLLTSQGNAGSSLGSGIYGSTNNAASGAVGASNGTTTAVLNSNQANTAGQTASISGSTACSGALN